MKVSTKVTFAKTVIAALFFSVDTVLYSREVDPAELLMDLGFGGTSTDQLARIPARFFQPSKVSLIVCVLH